MDYDVWKAHNPLDDLDDDDDEPDPDLARDRYRDRESIFDLDDAPCDE